MEEEKIIFRTSKVAPHGQVTRIRYVNFISPEGYYSLPDVETRQKLTQAIGRLNKLMEKESFIFVGPGRWGTVNPDLGPSRQARERYC